MVQAKGEFYSGYNNGEIPRFAIIEGRRIAVTEVIRRKRSRIRGPGKTRDVFSCMLADGRVVDIVEESSAQPPIESLHPEPAPSDR